MEKDCRSSPDNARLILWRISPALVIMYMVFHVPAGPGITIALALTAAQLVFGRYLTFNWQVRWYRPAIITVAIGIIIAIAVPLTLASFFPYI